MSSQKINMSTGDKKDGDFGTSAVGKFSVSGISIKPTAPAATIPTLVIAQQTPNSKQSDLAVKVFQPDADEYRRTWSQVANFKELECMSNPISQLYKVREAKRSLGVESLWEATLTVPGQSDRTVGMFGSRLEAIRRATAAAFIMHKHSNKSGMSTITTSTTKSTNNPPKKNTKYAPINAVKPAEVKISSISASTSSAALKRKNHQQLNLGNNNNNNNNMAIASNMSNTIISSESKGKKSAGVVPKPDSLKSVPISLYTSDIPNPLNPSKRIKIHKPVEPITTTVKLPPMKMTNLQDVSKIKLPLHAHYNEQIQQFTSTGMPMPMPPQTLATATAPKLPISMPKIPSPFVTATKNNTIQEKPSFPSPNTKTPSPQKKSSGFPDFLPNSSIIPFAFDSTLLAPLPLPAKASRRIKKYVELVDNATKRVLVCFRGNLDAGRALGMDRKKVGRACQSYGAATAPFDRLKLGFQLRYKKASKPLAAYEYGKHNRDYMPNVGDEIETHEERMARWTRTFEEEQKEVARLAVETKIHGNSKSSGTATAKSRKKTNDGTITAAMFKDSVAALAKASESKVNTMTGGRLTGGATLISTLTSTAYAGKDANSEQQHPYHTANSSTGAEQQHPYPAENSHYPLKSPLSTLKTTVGDRPSFEFSPAEVPVASLKGVTTMGPLTPVSLRRPSPHDQNNMCVICQTQKARIVFHPCHHCVLCANCSGVKGHCPVFCPVCRTRIDSRLQSKFATAIRPRIYSAYSFL